MTNEDKRELRRILRTDPDRSDSDIQRQIGCSLATVKKYRRAMLRFAKPENTK